MSSIASNTISVLGGAALGAVAAYLLDPDTGGKRRSDILNNASDAVSSGVNAVSSGVNKSSSSAKNLASTIGGYANHLVDHVSGRAADASSQAQAAAESAHQQIKDSVSPWVDKAKDYASDLHDRRDATARRLSDQAKSALQRQTGWEPVHSYNVAGITIGSIVTLGLGAAAMYFLDPTRGHSRRSWAEEKLFSLAGKASKSAKGYGRHLGNKAQGAVAEAKRSMPDDWSKAVDQAADTAAKVVQSASHSHPTHQ